MQTKFLSFSPVARDALFAFLLMILGCIPFMPVIDQIVAFSYGSASFSILKAAFTVFMCALGFIFFWFSFRFWRRGFHSIK